VATKKKYRHKGDIEEEEEFSEESQECTRKIDNYLSEFKRNTELFSDQSPDSIFQSLISCA